MNEANEKPKQATIYAIDPNIEGALNSVDVAWSCLLSAVNDLRAAGKNEKIGPLLAALEELAQFNQTILLKELQARQHMDKQLVELDHMKADLQAEQAAKAAHALTEAIRTRGLVE